MGTYTNANNINFSEVESSFESMKNIVHNASVVFDEFLSGLDSRIKYGKPGLIESINTQKEKLESDEEIIKKLSDKYFETKSAYENKKEETNALSEGLGPSIATGGGGGGGVTLKPISESSSTLGNLRQLASNGGDIAALTPVVVDTATSNTSKQQDPDNPDTPNIPHVAQSELKEIEPVVIEPDDPQDPQPVLYGPPIPAPSQDPQSDPQPDPTTDPIPTVTPNGPSQPGGIEPGSEIESVLSSAKEGMEKIGGGILNVVKKGAEKATSGISPFISGTTGSGSTISANNASAGILAAAGVAAGGAAAGGGVLIGKKLAMLRFTPEDWKALGEDYQTMIEKEMKSVGFSKSELGVFKTSNFKIAADELKTHAKKIEKVLKNNSTIEDELIDLYNFSMLDDNKKVIDYLLFITMLIDGKNTIDDHNIYNVINQYFEKVDDADYTYTGIYMEDYIDDEEEEEVQILNDPTIPKEEKKEQKEEEETQGNLEEEAFSYTQDKEWLKDIGLTDI